jgi:hypothetical protein
MDAILSWIQGFAYGMLQIVPVEMALLGLIWVLACPTYPGASSKRRTTCGGTASLVSSV